MGTASAATASPHPAAASDSCDTLPAPPAFGPRGPNTILRLGGLHPCQASAPIVNEAVRGPNKGHPSFAGTHPVQPAGTPIVNEAVRGPNKGHPSFAGTHPAQPPGTPIVNDAVRGPNKAHPTFAGTHPAQPPGTPIVNDAVRGANSQPSFGNTGGPGVIAAPTG
ncbi:hypothetical protein [Pseudonocardia spinosispora]|uniref:hypothetical protein n=1 Tax=Pseudonocardia spinosispora TaxID=103441 RepID=UPI0012EC5919|nr:hypothetical protein [Pseudonocardia spinosispora]